MLTFFEESVILTYNRSDDAGNLCLARGSPHRFINEKGLGIHIMVSTMKIVIMILCVLVCAGVMAAPCFLIHRRSSKLETGLVGALCYGFLGYIWFYIFYMFCGALVVRMIPRASVWLGLYEFFLTLLTTALTVLSLFWGIYLTNQKQRSIYRSAAVGIGFSLGKTAIDLFYPYLYSLYFSFQINRGTFAANPAIKDSILKTSTSSLLMGSYKCILMFAFLFYLALIMGDLYLKKDTKRMAVTAAVLYEAVTLLNVVLQWILPGLAASIIFVVLLSVLAAGCVVVLRHWFASGEVVINPLDILPGLKKRYHE